MKLWIFLILVLFTIITSCENHKIVKKTPVNKKALNFEANIEANSLKRVTKVNSVKSTHYLDMIVCYENKMLENKEYTVGAYLISNKDKAKVLNEIAKYKNTEIEILEESSKVILIGVSTNYIIEIIYDKDDFELLSGNEKILGHYKGPRTIHEWRIKPIASGKKKTLTISVKNIDENGYIYTAIPCQTLTIDVKVDTSSIWGKLWRFLRDNPQYTLTSIIIPIVITLYKRRQKKKKLELS